MNVPLEKLCQTEQAFAKEKGEDLTAFEALKAARESLPFGVPDDPRDRIAFWIVAPCLAGFALWIKEQRDRYPQATTLGVMREGRFLANLVTTLFHAPTQELWLNRDMALRMAFACGDDEALLNWLVRTRLHALSEQDALKVLLPDQSEPSGGTVPMDEPAAITAMARWQADGRLAQARMAASAMKQRFLRHWDRLVGEKDEAVLLLDFACAGNIQRSLHTVLLAENRGDPTLGLNFITTQGVRWAREAGATLSGYLADGGQPAWFSSLYARTPEFIELFVAAPVGALQDYDEDGQPVLAPPVLTEEQKNWLVGLQPGLMEAIRFYIEKMPNPIPASLGRIIWGRLLDRPTLAEAAAFADWQLDAGMEGRPARRLAPPQSDEAILVRKDRVAWPAASRVLAGSRPKN